MSASSGKTYTHHRKNYYKNYTKGLEQLIQLILRKKRFILPVQIVITTYCDNKQKYRK
jgi:hypothetical protein